MGKGQDRKYNTTRRYNSMIRLKSSFFLVVLMLITLGVFIVELDAQDTETNRAIVQEFVEKAEELVEQDKTEEAIELYERIVKAAPDDFESRIQLAKLYEAEGNEAAAIEAYKKASVYEHGDKNVYLRLAEHFFLNEDMAGAEN
ncbi:tetratricopeptide repeat protein, partial [Candidatus Poribacteria bacterium]|nr:tetratricopeptide repeat protein [Candidatus Poribacteria bacterium]